MRIFNKPPHKPSDHPDFFNMTANEIIEKELVYPDYEGQHPLFEKFGVRTGGICDVWVQIEEWKSLPEKDKWKYIALCALYWEQQYKYWLEKAEYREYLAELKANGQIERYNSLKGQEEK